MIHTLLFDIGDVLLEIDWTRRSHILFGKVFDENGVPLNLEQLNSIVSSGVLRHLADRLGRGELSTTDFLEQAMHLTRYNGDIAFFRNALSDVFVPLATRIDFFNRLSQRDDCVLAFVSDTNALHVEHIEHSFPELFMHIPDERRFYSHRIGAQKKNGPAIYQHVVTALNVPPENVVMIDDRLQNKPGCDALGIEFLHVLKEDDLEEKLSPRLDPT